MDTFSIPTSGNATVNIGFKPKYLCIRYGRTTPTDLTYNIIMIYDERYSTTKYIGAGTSAYLTSYNLGDTSNNRLYSINDNGFTTTKASSSNSIGYYFAVG